MRHGESNICPNVETSHQAKGRVLKSDFIFQG